MIEIKPTKIRNIFAWMKSNKSCHCLLRESCYLRNWKALASALTEGPCWYDRSAIIPSPFSARSLWQDIGYMLKKVIKTHKVSIQYNRVLFQSFNLLLSEEKDPKRIFMKGCVKGENLKSPDWVSQRCLIIVQSVICRICHKNMPHKKAHKRVLLSYFKFQCDFLNIFYVLTL